MGLFDDPAGDWTRTAVALGLTLCPVQRGFDPTEESVHAIARRLGPAGQGGHPDRWWARGEQRGVSFVAGGRTVEHHTEEGTHYEHFTHWIAEIDPPLWMGLSGRLNKGNLLSQLFETNTPQFSAWDPGRLQQLFGWRVNDGRDAWDMLGGAFRSGLKVELDDHAVRFERDGYALSPQAVGSALDGVTTVAERLKAARAQMGPAPWELQAFGAWGAFATRFSLAFDRERLRVHGPLEGSRVDVRLVGGTLPRTLLRVRYPSPLGMGLFIAPGHVSGLARFFGAQDVQLGDPAFDQAFVVRGNPEPLVRQVVHASMRQELLAFVARGARVRVEDDHMEAWLPGMLFDGPQLDELLLRGMAVVRGFWRR